MPSTEQVGYSDPVFGRAVFEAEHNGEDWAINELADMIVDASPEDRIRLIRAWARSARLGRDGRQRTATEEAKKFTIRRQVPHATSRSAVQHDMMRDLLRHAAQATYEKRWFAIQFCWKDFEPAPVPWIEDDVVLVLELTVDPIV